MYFEITKEIELSEIIAFRTYKWKGIMKTISLNNFKQIIFKEFAYCKFLTWDFANEWTVLGRGLGIFAFGLGVTCEPLKLSGGPWVPLILPGLAPLGIGLLRVNDPDSR